MDAEKDWGDFLNNQITAEYGLFFEPKKVVGRAYVVLKFISPKTKRPDWLRVRTSKNSFSSQIETRVQRADLDRAFTLVLKEAVKVRLLADKAGKVLEDIPSDLQQFRFRTGDCDMSATFSLLATFAAAAQAHQAVIAHYKNMAESYHPKI